MMISSMMEVSLHASKLYIRVAERFPQILPMSLVLVEFYS